MGLNSHFGDRFIVPAEGTNYIPYINGKDQLPTTIKKTKLISVTFDNNFKDDFPIVIVVDFDKVLSFS